MQKLNGELVYSPTDLVRFMESPFASWMERARLECPGSFQPDPETPEQRLVATTGDRHERSYLEKLELEGKQICVIQKDGASFGEAHLKTIEAIQAGTPVIYQAALRLPPFQGYADFLARGERGPGYEIFDTKLARHAKPCYLVQLCCYAEMLAANQGVLPEFLKVVLGDQSILAFRTESFFYVYLELKGAFLSQMESFDLGHPPDPAPRANHGRWQSHAEHWLAGRDHLAQVAGITLSQIARLNQAGIVTVAQLAASQETAIPKLDIGIKERLVAQAALQLETHRRRDAAGDGGFVRPAFRLIDAAPEDPRRGLALLPPRSDLDVYFDMEGFPFVAGGLEYLLGASHSENGRVVFQDWWAHDAAEEKLAFEEFLDWAYARWKADPDMHIYHYANYEIAALRKLMGKHGTRESELDDLLRHEVFIDLYQVVRQGVRIGESSYSLKSIERLYRPERTADLQGASESMVYYAAWLDSGQSRDWRQSEILRKIREYNRDDCESTAQLTSWLRGQQERAAIRYVPKPAAQVERQEKGVSEKVQAQLELAGEMAAAIPSDPAERARNQDRWQIHELLMQLLQFHWREDKPVWWRMFDWRAMTPEELWDDLNCLAKIELVPGEPVATKRSWLFKYRFDPDQETKIREADKVMFAHEAKARMIVASFDPEGRLELKISRDKLAGLPDGRMPSKACLIPDEFVSSETIEEAILEIVRQWQNSGRIPEAFRKLILRLPPELPGEPASVSLTRPGESAAEAAVRIVAAMRASTLCIQGPPGAGKTSTASGIMAGLLARGKDVGVSSNSHKAINNLIAAVHKKMPGGLVGVKVGPDEGDSLFDECPGVRWMKDAKTAAADYCGGFIAGTAWLFSRPEMAGKLDYLFVDEAGQVSLANLLGMSRSAGNIILLGDQMQLEQPIQGSHPGESGFSALAYYLKGQATIPKHLGLFLETSFRMHPDICRFISETVYEGRLAPNPQNASRVLELASGRGRRGRYIFKPAGIIFSPVEHDGNAQCSEEEVERILEIVEELLELKLRDGPENPPRNMALADILIVAPYNMQVRRLRAALPGARVGSVDKFQGQEAAVVIVSMCASAGEFGTRGLQFLLDKNRLNVAVSRAQTLAVMVGDPRIGSTPCASIEDLERVNMFCRLKG